MGIILHGIIPQILSSPLVRNLTTFFLAFITSAVKEEPKNSVPCFKKIGCLELKTSTVCTWYMYATIKRFAEVKILQFSAFLHQDGEPKHGRTNHRGGKKKRRRRFIQPFLTRITFIGALRIFRTVPNLTSQVNPVPFILPGKLPLPGIEWQGNHICGLLQVFG